MATVETQVLDEIIVRSRRKLLSLGGAALAGLVVGGATETASAAAYNDADILNFALNLEYLEANFYYYAAFGCTIDKPNAAAITAGAPAAGIPISGTTLYTGTTSVAGGTAVTTGATIVPFGTNLAVQAYANETAIEEGKHVLFLQKALSTSAVAQPLINIGGGTAGTAFATLGGALTPSAPTFTPYDSATDFLLGAYIFEDVGVTAYHGAASLLTVSANLSAAAAILGVEAYHAGLIRTSITAMDAANGTNVSGTATAISNLRAALSRSALLGVTPPASAYDPQPDDYGPSPTVMYNLDSLATSNSVAKTGDRIIDADQTYTIAFARTTTQVLNIVTGGGAVNTTVTPNTIISPAKGVFFTNGLNAATVNGFR
jgi:hypothetical protein